MLYPSAFSLVQQHILTGTGDDGEAVVTCQTGDGIRAAAGAVDKITTGNGFAICGCYGVTFSGCTDFGNGKIPQKICTVVHGVAHSGDGQIIGGNDAGRGNVQRLCHSGGKVGFKGACFLTGQDGHALNAVFQTTLIQIVDLRLFLLAKRTDERAVAHIGNMEFLCSLVQKGYA